jgi:LacI family transcriptional regulator
MIAGPEDVSTSVDRVAGYRRALIESGLGENEQVYYGGFNQQSGYDFTKQVMTQSLKPTAIFGANNFIAIGIIKALRDFKISVPGNVSVVAFDDFPESMLGRFFDFAEQPAMRWGEWRLNCC